MQLGNDAIERCNFGPPRRLALGVPFVREQSHGSIERQLTLCGRRKERSCSGNDNPGYQGHLSDRIPDAMLEPEAYGWFAHSGILAGRIALAEKYLPLGAIAFDFSSHVVRLEEPLLVSWTWNCKITTSWMCRRSLLSKELSLAAKGFVTTVVNDADIIPKMNGARFLPL